VAQHNADDCLSTLSNWLERERAVCEQVGRAIPRPVATDGVPQQSVDERQQRTDVLDGRLRLNIPENSDQRSSEQTAIWLLSNLLDWHRRERKADLWEFYRLGDLSDEDLLDERSALSGLRFVERLGIQRNVPTDRYEFQRQETDIRPVMHSARRGRKLGKPLRSISRPELLISRKPGKLLKCIPALST
jgi:uncharacterized protein